jgi:hypothetical protein
MNRLRKRPADAGALRLLDVGETKGSTFSLNRLFLFSDSPVARTTRDMLCRTRNNEDLTPFLPLIADLRAGPQSPRPRSSRVG